MINVKHKAILISGMRQCDDIGKKHVSSFPKLTIILNNLHDMFTYMYR